MESIRGAIDSLAGMRVAHLYGPLSVEDRAYIATTPLEQAAGKAVEAALDRLGFDVDTLDPTGDLLAALPEYDLIFNNLHGPFGEDGTLQALLEFSDVPYTGSGIRASAAALHKPTAKLLARGVGVPVAEGLSIGPLDELEGRALPAPPWVVKPAVGGSSVGLSLARDEPELAESVDAARAVDQEVLVERHVEGRDLTVGVLGGGETPPVPLAVVEILASGRTYGEDAKLRDHWSGDVRYESPARLDERCRGLVEDLSVRVHKALGCIGFSRLDWRLSATGEPTFLELNTNPGLSEKGNFALSAAGAGISYDDLILLMVASAGKRAGSIPDAASRDA